MGERLRGNEWFTVRETVLDRDGRQCLNCRATSNLVVHHIVPISGCGTNRTSNLVTLCRDCHQSAHNHRSGTVGDTATRVRERDILTVEDVTTFLYSVTHPLTRAILLTLAKTGIGVGELCNLNMSDLDCSGSGTTVPAAFDGPAMRIRYGGEIPYNNRRERTDTTFIPVDSELTRALKRWLAIRPDHSEDQALFTKTRDGWGTRLEPSTVRYRFTKVRWQNDEYSTDDEGVNLSPVALRYFFEERFRGKPKYRAYILGQIDPSAIDFSSLEQNYRENIFELVRHSQRL